MEIIGKMKSLQDHKSIAVRTKVRRALAILLNENEPIPFGWSKSKESPKA